MIRPAAYIFDFDGTLGTIPVDWDGVRRRLRELAGDQEEFKPVFPAVAGVVARRPELLRPVLSVIDEFEWAAVPSAKLYEGSYGLLERLSNASKLSLVTMQGERACSSLLERFGIGRFFVSHFVREDSLDRGEQLEMARSSLGSNKESTMFVGDRLNDLEAARRVGLLFTLIRTHGEDPEKGDVPVYHSISEFAAAVPG